MQLYLNKTTRVNRVEGAALKDPPLIKKKKKEESILSSVIKKRESLWSDGMTTV